MFPIVVDVRDRRVVVVGGGPVGRRKAHAALDAGANVSVICLEPMPDDEAHPNLSWSCEPYRDAHLTEAFLVFAAATSEVNAQVAHDAHRLGVLVNVASEPEVGNFLVPSILRRGEFVLAVSTSGTAPLLSRSIRRHLEDEFDDAFAVWVELLAELRPLLRERIPDPQQRRPILERLCEWHWLERLRNEPRDVIRKAMLSLIDT